MRDLFRYIEVIAAWQPVLITGETGVGRSSCKDGSHRQQTTRALSR
jgi:DNA-binding NtrC family response regulator